jgi:hypothetical protein
MLFRIAIDFVVCSPGTMWITEVAKRTDSVTSAGLFISPCPFLCLLSSLRWPIWERKQEKAVE